jgi:hypothetical protein
MKSGSDVMSWMLMFARRDDDNDAINHDLLLRVTNLAIPDLT